MTSRIPGPISKATAQSFPWRDVCLGWTLLDSPTLHVVQERMPPAMFELRHLHQHTRQLYFILEGSASVEREGERFTLGVGEAIEIAPGIPHQMRNDSRDDIEFLVVSSGQPRKDRTDLEY